MPCGQYLQNHVLNTKYKLPGAKIIISRSLILHYLSSVRPGFSGEEATSRCLYTSGKTRKARKTMYNNHGLIDHTISHRWSTFSKFRLGSSLEPLSLVPKLTTHLRTPTHKLKQWFPVRVINGGYQWITKNQKNRNHTAMVDLADLGAPGTWLKLGNHQSHSPVWVGGLKKS